MLDLSPESLCFLLPVQNKCTQPEDVKLCTLILRPAAAGPQRKKVVSLLTVFLLYSLRLLSTFRWLSMLTFMCSVSQTLAKEALVHPLEVEPGQFLPQTEQSPPPPPPPSPPPAPHTSSQSVQARISLAISVGPAPAPSTVTRSALLPRPPTLEDGMRGREGWRERSGGKERWGTTKERVRGRLSQQKERKATQMLAIVLGE